MSVDLPSQVAVDGLEVTVAPDLPTSSHPECAVRPSLGHLTAIGEGGTHLDRGSLWASFLVGAISAGSVHQSAITLREALLERLHDSHSTVVGPSPTPGHKFYCSTLDELERPTQVKYFTPSLAEWVNSFALDDRPILVGLGPRSSSVKTTNVGLETVRWIADMFGYSQEMACRVARISTATFYMWKKRPNTAVRPATVKDGLRLRAALEQLIFTDGALPARSVLTEGSPSVLDQLLEAGSWENGLAAIKSAAASERRQAEIRRPTGVSDYLRDLEALPTAAGEVETIAGQQMTPDQIADADHWGWGRGRS